MDRFIDINQRLRPEEALGIPLKEIDGTVLEEVSNVVVFSLLILKLFFEYSPA